LSLLSVDTIDIEMYLLYVGVTKGFLAAGNCI